MFKKENVKDNLLQMKCLLKLIFPEGRNEIILFFLLISFYFSYSSILIFKTSIIDNSFIPFDLYFSFDNPTIYKQGHGDLFSHPLMKYFLSPFIFLGNIIANLFFYKGKTIFLCGICMSIISLSIIYLKRYLNQVIGLTGYPLYILIILFALFSTNLILCFTPESFTFFAFTFSFTIYFYSNSIKEKKDVGLLPSSFLAIVLGGMTTTNFVKGLIPMLFVEQKNKIIIKRVFVVCLIFGLLVLFVELTEGFIAKALDMYFRNKVFRTNDVYKSGVVNFFTTALFFPIVISAPIVTDGHHLQAICFGSYRIWQYIVVALLWFFVLISLVQNLKNKYMYILILCFSVDILLHIILGFGLWEPFIYGAHWVFIIPCILGWLFSKNKKTLLYKFSMLGLSLITIILVVNNLIQVGNFIKESLLYYPY